jgi:hypothetical protein
MNGNNITEQQAQKEREKFVTAFNDTMIKIWQEQITLLGVIDTGALLASPKAIAMRADGRFFEVSLSQAFLEYGLWQDYGTGRETPRGNSGDFGRAKKRKRRKEKFPNPRRQLRPLSRSYPADFITQNKGKYKRSQHEKHLICAESSLYIAAEERKEKLRDSAARAQKSRKIMERAWNTQPCELYKRKTGEPQKKEPAVLFQSSIPAL